MQKKTISEIQEIYELELDRIDENIKKSKAKIVLLQFPDGMKPYSTAIADELKTRNKNSEFLIWFSTCFGACDIPPINDKSIDLVVQFGHSPWNYRQNLKPSRVLESLERNYTSDSAT